MRVITICYIATALIASNLSLSCSSQKELSSVEVIKPPPVVVKKEEPPATPPPVEEAIDFKYRTVHFDFDSAEVLHQNREYLDRLADFLTTHDGIALVIAGHADERGSLDYNLSLGEQRAQSVRVELQKRGVAPERIRVVSYGEERPAVYGHDETAYSQNRRAEFNEIR